MAYDNSIKQHALKLRERGYSIKEVSKKLNIAISTSSVWLKDVVIQPSGLIRMQERHELKRYKMSQKWVDKNKKQYQINYQKAKSLLSTINLKDENIAKLICAILFWAEGNKNFSHVRFTNSDPTMITTFLNNFHRGFVVDESKFRACIHLHEYHNKQEIHEYWSSITKIPLSKFRKAYLKLHTGQRKKIDYKGCITIYYFSSSIAHELQALYNAVSDDS